MTDKHYDVVVLGASLGALLAAAVLARRGFRVLVLGQGAKPPSYRFGPYVLRRSAHTMLGASSPLFRRALTELAQTQTFRRRTVALDPMVGILLPERRIDLPPDRALFDREIEREFPEARRSVAELYAELGQWNAAVDAALEHDVVLPPGTFWERRRAARMFAAILPMRASEGLDQLAPLPPSHDYRRIVRELVRFGTDLDTGARDLPPFALARLHGSWTRGMVGLVGGEQELVDLLYERVAAQGGTCRPRDRAVRVVPGRGSALEVSIDGDTTPTGATFVLSDDTGEGLARLSGGEGIVGQRERDWPEVRASRGRFTVSLVVRAEGVPEPLARESLVLSNQAESARTPWDALHVVKMEASEPASGDGPRDPVLLVVEALVRTDGEAMPPSAQGARTGPSGDLLLGREKILATLARALPFLQSHLVVVDSPHDGRPLWVYEAGTRRDVERVHLAEATMQPEPMAMQYVVDPPSVHGLAGEPLRGPLAHTFLVGRTVLPALGQEGQILAALGAALLVTKSDRQKERMRQAMWSRIEIG